MLQRVPMSAGFLMAVTGVTAAFVADPQRVQFVVVAPDALADQPARIFLASSADGWDERGRPLERSAPGVYSATLELAAGVTVEYKFTRAGSWATVEKGGDGRELPNRTLTVDPHATEQVVVCRVEKWADRPVPAQRRVEFGPAPSDKPGAPASAPATTRASTLTGDIRFHPSFLAPQLHNERTIAVYLPPGYDDRPAERYPVLYLHDGNNVFDAATSFAGVEWQADETAERLIKAGRIRDLIIVGIYNNAERISEYTPFRDPPHGGGNGDAYLAFIVDTLKPFIDRTYRTQPEREHTGLAGSSLGGLISLYAAYKYPQVFGFAGVISPALGWAGRAVLPYVRDHKPAPLPRLWIDIGTAEGRRSEPDDVAPPVQDCRALVRILEAQGYRPEVDLHYEEIAGGRHHEADWARRFERVLTFFCGQPQQARAFHAECSLTAASHLQSP